MKRDKNIQNEQNEIREWALFNLMEGNLTEIEEADLLKQLEADAELAEELEGLYLTKLPSEAIIYSNKTSLIKKEATPIILMNWWQRPMGIAASIAIVFLMAVPLYMFVSQSDPNTGLSSIHQNVPTQPKTEIAIIDEKKPVDGKTSEFNVPIVQTNLPESNQVYSSKISKIETATTPTSIGTGLDSVEIPNPQTQLPIIAYSIIPKVESLDFVTPIKSKSRQVEGTRVKPVLTQVLANADNSEYTGLRNAFSSGLNALVEPVRNSSVRIRRIGIKGDPGLKIEVYTEQYVAIASLHLLPKSNR